MNKIASKLDWTRMLGFEQIADTRATAKVGNKVGVKVGVKLGVKLGAKIGLKN